MVSVLLIGMGKFGRTLGENLVAMGDEVMIVDKDEDVINALSGTYTNALIADCLHETNLRSMDIPSFDACVVAIGENFQSSLEITSNLKDLGAKRVISRATTEIQSKFLMRVGADEVIYPDKDIAEKLAVRLNSDNIINFIDLDAEYSIFEIALPRKWTGKKLADVTPRARYGMNILTVKRADGSVEYSLDANFTFLSGDQIVVFGNSARVLAFTNKQS